MTSMKESRVPQVGYGNLSLGNNTSGFKRS